MSEQTKQYINIFTALCGRPPHSIVELARFLAMVKRWNKELSARDHPVTCYAQDADLTSRRVQA